MSQVEVDKVIPQSGTTLTIGDSGDTVTIPSGATLAIAGSVTGFTSAGIDDNATSVAITIDSSERVGIGSTAPGTDAGANADSLVIKKASGNVGMSIITDGSSNANIFLGDTSDNLNALVQFNDSANELRVGTSNGGGDLVLKSGAGVEALRINDTGKVGIGTTSPVSKVNIEATKTTALSSMNDFLTIGLTVDDNTAYNEGVGGGIAFRGKRQSGGQQTVFGAIVGTKRDNSNDGYNGNLRFFTNNNGNGIPTEHLRITSAGLVGIGETAPLGKLHVKSADSGASANSGHNQVVAENSGNSGMSILSGNSSNGAVCFGDDGNNCIGYINYAHNGNHLDFGVSGAERMRVDHNSGARLFLGTTSDTSHGSADNNRLIVSGHSNNGAGLIGFVDTSGNTDGTITANDGNLIITADTQQTASNSSMQLRVDNSEKVRIVSSGYVGIGKSNPQNKIDINAETWDDGLTIKNAGNFNVGIIGDANRSGAGGGLLNLQARWNGTEVAGILFNAGSDTTNKDDGVVTFRTASAGTPTERMRIASDGVVGIGTTSPSSSYRLSAVGGTGAVVGAFIETTSTDSGHEASIIKRPNSGVLIQFLGSGQVGSITTNGSSTTYSTSSDYRLKENVSYDFDATTRLKQLKPARFNFIVDADTTVDGFIAHEVSDIVPEAISGEKDAMKTEEYEVTPAVLDEDGNVITEAVMGTREVPDYQGIDQSKLVPLLVKTIQELEARITTLENA